MCVCVCVCVYAYTYTHAHIQVFMQTGKLLQRCEHAHTAVEEIQIGDSASLSRAKTAITAWGSILVGYKHNIPCAASEYSVAQRDRSFVEAVAGVKCVCMKHTHMCMFMYICMYICMYVCMCVRFLSILQHRETGASWRRTSYTHTNALTYICDRCRKAARVQRT